MKTNRLLASVLPLLLVGCATHPYTKLMTSHYERLVVLARDSDTSDWIAAGLVSNDVPALSVGALYADGEKISGLADFEKRCHRMGIEGELAVDRQAGAVSLLDLAYKSKVMTFHRTEDYDLSGETGRQKFCHDLAQALKWDGVVRGYALRSGPRPTGFYSDLASQVSSPRDTGTSAPNHRARARQTYDESVVPNGYGLGVNRDQYGAPHVYRLQDGEQLSPIFNEGVKRDAYGLGVHMDQFGRAVYDSKP